MMYYYVSHELSHAAHYSNNQNDYNNYSKAIKDSWAYFAGLTVYEEEYGIHANNHLYIYEEMWPNIDNINYSPLFLDLKDDHNQSDELIALTLPNDVVSGFSNLQLCAIMSVR